MGKHINQGPLGDHEVGYKRTPANTRYPNQKRKAPAKKPPREIATRQVMMDFYTALEQPVVQLKNGRKRRIPAAVAIYDALVAQAASGKPWAVRRVIDMNLQFAREYEAEYCNYLGELANFDEHIKRTQRPLSPEGEALRQEMLRRVSNPRELFKS